MGNKGSKSPGSRKASISADSTQVTVTITPKSQEVKQVTFDNFLHEFIEYTTQNKVVDENGLSYTDVIPFLTGGIQKNQEEAEKYILYLANAKMGDVTLSRSMDCLTVILKSMGHVRATQHYFHRTIISYPISSIVLRDCKLTIKSIPKIIYLLYNENILPLSSLDLSSNLFDDPAGPPLFEALHSNRTLKKLDLSANRFGNQTHSALGKLLASNQTLESVNLFSNLGSEQSLKNVVQSIKFNTSLRSLKLDFHICQDNLLINKTRDFIHRNEIIRDIVRALVESSLNRAYPNTKSNSFMPDTPNRDLYFASLQPKDQRTHTPKISQPSRRPSVAGSISSETSSPMSEPLPLHSSTYSPKPTPSETGHNPSLSSRRTKSYGVLPSTPVLPATTPYLSASSASASHDTPRSTQPKEMEVQIPPTQLTPKKIFSASKNRHFSELVQPLDSTSNPASHPTSPSSQPKPPSPSMSPLLPHTQIQPSSQGSLPPKPPSEVRRRLTPGLAGSSKLKTSPEGKQTEQLPRFQVGVAELQGRRLTMEDCVVVQENFRGRSNEYYFAIFDGHGGKDVSTYLSQNLHNQIIKSITGANDMPTCLTMAFETLNNSLASTHQHCGSTAGVVLVQNDTIYAANVGDTRIILCRDGVPKRLSVDHRPMLLQEAQRIRDLGGQITNHRVGGILAVTRAFGDSILSPYVIAKPHVTVQTLDFLDSTSEVIIIACDGVWDVMSDQEVAALAHKSLKSGSPNTTAKTIADAAYLRGSPDNISVMVIVAVKR